MLSCYASFFLRKKWLKLYEMSGNGKIIISILLLLNSKIIFNVMHFLYNDMLISCAHDVQDFRPYLLEHICCPAVSYIDLLKWRTRSWDHDRFFFLFTLYASIKSNSLSDCHHRTHVLMFCVKVLVWYNINRIILLKN